MEYKPNAYERDVLDTFKKVVEKTGYLKEFYFEEHNYGCGGMSIVKQFGKWTSYVYEKGSKIGQRWYIYCPLARFNIYSPTNLSGFGGLSLAQFNKAS